MKIKLLDIMERVENNNRAIRIGNLLSSDDEMIRLFYRRPDRMLMGSFTYLITCNDIDVGFINVLYEKDDYSFLVVDMGIIREYRGLGIGTRAMELLKKKNIPQFIIGETKKNNIGGNKSLKNIGIQIAESDKCNYYLIQKDRIEEFIDNDYLELLGRHYQDERFKILEK